MTVTDPSAVCMVSSQLQSHRRARRIFDPLTNTARSLSANALSANRKTPIFKTPLMIQPNLQSTLFLKANGLLVGN